MKTTQQVLACALLAALTALAAYTARCIGAATRVIATVPDQIAATRREFLAEARSARRDVVARSDRQLSLLRTETLAQVSQLREAADRRIGDTLARADAALDEVHLLRQDLKPALEHSGVIAAQISTSLPLFLDCDHNPDCVFNRYVGAAKGIERAALNFGQASTDVRSAVPGILTTWDRIGGGVAGTAVNLDRLTKPHWYDRLIGYGLNGVVIYRNLNPVTNLTVKGAQTLSSRP